jgi:hypothetical protein
LGYLSYDALKAFKQYHQNQLLSQFRVIVNKPFAKLSSGPHSDLEMQFEPTTTSLWKYTTITHSWQPQ